MFSCLHPSIACRHGCGELGLRVLRHGRAVPAFDYFAAPKGQATNVCQLLDRKFEDSSYDKRANARASPF
jgi:hypothetical protein